VPVKAATEYLRRLIGLGHRVAICEQVEDPKLAKGLVRRAVVETVTPGSVLADDWLERGRNNFLLAVDARSAPAGIAALDLTTGELLLETVASETSPRCSLATKPGNSCFPAARRLPSRFRAPCAPSARRGNSTPSWGARIWLAPSGWHPSTGSASSRATAPPWARWGRCSATRGSSNRAAGHTSPAPASSGAVTCCRSTR